MHKCHFTVSDYSDYGRVDYQHRRVQERVSGGGRARHGRVRRGHLQGRLSHVLQALHAVAADEGSEAKRGQFIINYKMIHMK